MITDGNILRILTMDDDETILAIFQQIFQNKLNRPTWSTENSPHTFEVATCLKGEDAVRAVKRSILENRPFAVAFVDIVMENGMGGVEAAERIRSMDPMMEIVMVTAFSDKDIRGIACRVLSPHKLHYLLKPFHPLEIYQYASALTSKWLTENELQQAYENLESRVQERTVELEDVNAALKVLLNRIQEDKEAAEEQVLSNVRELVVPFVDKLKRGKLSQNQVDCLKLLETNIEQIVSPFVKNIGSEYSNLTPTEIRVAFLIKEGKTTKEISELLSSSTRAIEFHRHSIRTKLGLRHKNTNLRSFLLSLSDQRNAD